MNLTHITTAPIPATGNPYSQAVRAGDLIFVSGQVAWDEERGCALPDGIEGQTRRVLDNLATVLEEAGSGLAQVVKTTCFLTDMADAPVFNSIYRSYFPDDRPARSTFAVAALTKGLVVEVEAVAVAIRPARASGD